MKKRILLLATAAVLACVVCVGLIQLIPIDRTNPAVTREVKWDSTQTRVLAQRACFDCHSDETVWPWYSRLAPLSFILVNHVSEGRGRLNFSEWDKPNSSIGEVQRTVNQGDMPLSDYLMIHVDARLTATEKEQLLAGLQTTFQNDPPIARQGGFDR